MTPLDIDLAIEGDAIAIAQRVGDRVGARVVVHQRFGTAKLSSRDFQFDLAGTRRETYPHPGSLPQVQPATLVEDLARRDFAINAFAMQLAPESGEIIDPFRGIDDLRSGLIRVLHERSFQDDATRMLRGVRYATASASNCSVTPRRSCAATCRTSTHQRPAAAARTRPPVSGARGS